MGIFRQSPEQKAREPYLKSTAEMLITSAPKLTRKQYYLAGRVAAVKIPEGEDILACSTGKHNGMKAVLAITRDRALVAWAQGLSTGTKELEIESLTQADAGVDSSGSWITLRAGSHEITLNKSANPGLVNIAEMLRAEISSRPPRAENASSSADQLAKLAELHASGALTDAEFTAAKSKILGL